MCIRDSFWFGLKALRDWILAPITVVTEGHAFQVHLRAGAFRPVFHRSKELVDRNPALVNGMVFFQMTFGVGLLSLLTMLSAFPWPSDENPVESTVHRATMATIEIWLHVFTFERLLRVE